ncbi:unnamed protein product, partial [Prorocentrum cordatum]
ANATVATSSVSPARAVAVIADTAGPGAEGSHALHSAEGGSALLPTATGPDALSRLRAACGAHPVRVAALGCLVAPAAYAVGKARSRCRRRSGGREPLRGSGAAEPALAMEEDLSPVYRGSFRHPAFEGEVPVVVRLDAAYRGSWLALGQTEEIDVCRSGSAVSLREVGGATILEGSIQSGTGAIFGTVVQDGVRGGAFELTPEPLGQEPPGWSPAAAPDASFVAQVPKHAGLADADAPPTPPTDFSDEEDRRHPNIHYMCVVPPGATRASRNPTACVRRAVRVLAAPLGKRCATRWLYCMLGLDARLRRGHTAAARIKKPCPFRHGTLAFFAPRAAR